MADSLGRGAGKPATGPTNPGSAKKKEKRVQGGRVVESRYLQYEKKTAQKAPAGDGSQTRGKTSEGGRKPSLLQKSKADSSGVAKGDLQSTLLEGHGTAPPDLDLSAINDKSVIRKTPQLAKTIPKKPDSTSFSAPRKKSPDLSEAMEMMESQTLLLTLLAVKMENNLAEFERRAEKNLLIMCKEKEKLQKTAHELKRRLLLSQRKRELADVLDAQVQMLSPFEAVAKRFREQYRTFATALDTTRHELPVRSIHLEGDGQQLLGVSPRCWNSPQRRAKRRPWQTRKSGKRLRAWRLLASGISIKIPPAENLREHPRTRPGLRTIPLVPRQPLLRPCSSAQGKTFLQAAKEQPRPLPLTQGGTWGDS
ncbi:HAUS augmin-like complex subunit 8 isoform X4 [Callithrix jacchus]|uniref:HAUS augmin-like complex subunit 8 isoform X3 n=1 Tax=Callithrix jacchus TaxID=9483 RepID=UPI0004F08A89|nr:HAUS augmin-like complex subunit 8 isoform X3 [Callithrix jacchus]